MKESYLYQKLEDSNVRCQTCSHYCKISPGQRGICGVRENIDGQLYFLAYGRAIAENIDPIEKKPFFHFLPGSYALSIATLGCNFRCANCQNWDISQGAKDPKLARKQIESSGFYLSAEALIQNALDEDTPSIAYTYTEPTVFLEYALEAMRLAKTKNLKNIWVSNGYMSKESLELILPYLDAINIDIKSIDDDFYQKNCGAKIGPVLENAKKIVQYGIWLETTTLIIPTLSDDEKMLKKLAEFIKKELGATVPWHVTSFSGAISWKLQNLPDTPTESLKKAYQIGIDTGLKYVYTGNLPNLNSENTFCPKCGQLIITRHGYQINREDKAGLCPKCKTKIDLILK